MNEPRQAPAQPASDAGTAAPTPALGAVWTVLCVDDEANILSALKRVLRSAGYCVVTAGDAAQALVRLEEMPIDIVISDMRMPGMDGAALLEQVQQRWPAIPRLLLTGHADMGATVAAINRGKIFRYLHKPWDDHELKAALGEAVDRIALEREKARLEALTREQNEQLRVLNQDLEQRVDTRTAELKAAFSAVLRDLPSTHFTGTPKSSRSAAAIASALDQDVSSSTPLPPVTSTGHCWMDVMTGC